MDSNERTKLVAEHDQATASVEATWPGHMARMFKAYQAEGFTEPQAFTLVKIQVHATYSQKHEENTG